MGPDGIVNIMIDICDLIRKADDFPLHGHRHPGCGMVHHTIPDFLCQIQAFTVFFQQLHNPDTLIIMFESIGVKFIKNILACMTERRMSQIMPQGNGLRQILIHPKGSGYGPGNLGDFQRMCQPRPVMIPGRRQKNLSFMLHPPKRLGMKNPVSVSLIHRTYVTLGFLSVPSERILAQGCIRT